MYACPRTSRNSDSNQDAPAPSISWYLQSCTATADLWQSRCEVGNPGLYSHGGAAWGWVKTVFSTP